MSPEKSETFLLPFQHKHSKGSVFQYNDQRMFEIGYYAYFTHTTVI